MYMIISKTQYVNPSQLQSEISDGAELVGGFVHVTAVPLYEDSIKMIELPSGKFVYCSLEQQLFRSDMIPNQQCYHLSSRG